ncbi:hypothetical protein J437_LFUL013681 [Ladona fulva]|uniref:Histone H2A n=1 Tax=Ladona fulva TaxID=123851 RepID=A0A8K0KDK5_LADFU|nr:hypothetical protein J437_LFUL013681 [Ladona fulva]
MIHSHVHKWRGKESPSPVLALLDFSSLLGIYIICCGRKIMSVPEHFICPATVIEYLTAEVLELARNAACDNKIFKIIPCHLTGREVEQASHWSDHHSGWCATQGDDINHFA